MSAVAGVGHMRGVVVVRVVHLESRDGCLLRLGRFDSRVERIWFKFDVESREDLLPFIPILEALEERILAQLAQDESCFGQGVEVLTWGDPSFRRLLTRGVGALGSFQRKP